VCPSLFCTKPAEEVCYKYEKPDNINLVVLSAKTLRRVTEDNDVKTGNAERVVRDTLGTMPPYCSPQQV
jgi:hypothetical protein